MQSLPSKFRPPRCSDIGAVDIGEKRTGDYRSKIGVQRTRLGLKFRAADNKRREEDESRPWIG